MGKADLHVHTAEGDGMASIPDLLAYVESSTDLDLVAVTDHDDIHAAVRARDMAVQQNRRFGVIPGIEITTLEGHLIALWVDEPIQSMRSLRHTIEAVRRQGGVCMVPHPLSWLTRSVGGRSIERLLARAGETIDAMEVANQSPAGRVTRDRAIALNRARLHAAEVGGSDAHFIQAVGTSYTDFPGTTAADLRAAIAARTTAGVCGPHYPNLADIGYGRIVYQQVRSWTVTPRRVIGRPMARALRKGFGR